MAMRRWRRDQKSKPEVNENLYSPEMVAIKIKKNKKK